MTHASNTQEFEDFLSLHKPLPVSSTFRADEVLGAWRLTAFLGKGGSGEVYRAEHLGDSRVAALKVHIRRPDASDAQEAAARTRFEREARILSVNTYPFFPKFYEFSEARGYQYLAMELLESIALPKSDSGVAAFLLELCLSVRTLHGHGLIHRDIKPQNIMRRANGQLVLIDLGLVKEWSAFEAHVGASVTIVDGKVVGVGTPRYAAPEQFSGGAISPATDIHALGMLANECFGGRPPRAWDRIISRATSSIPERRYADVNELAQAIRRRRCARTVAWGALAFAVVGLALASFWFFSLRRGTSPQLSDSPSADLGRTVEAASNRRQDSMRGVDSPTNAVARGVDAPASRASIVRSVLSAQDLATTAVTNRIKRQFLGVELETNVVRGVVAKESKWRTVTNSVIEPVLRLDNQKIKFDQPLVLSPGGVYQIIGPGTLDATIEGGPGASLWLLSNCVLINRTVKSMKECGINYYLLDGSYLNFINQETGEIDRSYVELFDKTRDAVAFHGPETLSEALARQESIAHSEFSWQDLAATVVTNQIARQFLGAELETNAVMGVVVKESKWRTVTNSVIESVLRLDNRKVKFNQPLVLSPGGVYRLVGPGTLDATIEGGPGARIFLDNCVLINRTTRSMKDSGITYVFGKGSYLNFINREDSEDYRPYVEDFDGAYNALEFHGPETAEEVVRRRNAANRRMLDLETW